MLKREIFLVLVCGLGAAVLLPFSGGDFRLSAVSAAWAASGCVDADHDGHNKYHPKWCPTGDDPDDSDPCVPDGCDGGGGGSGGGLGSAIPLDCFLGASWAPPPPAFPVYTVTGDKLGPYQDAVDKVNCEIGGPSVPWPVRLVVGEGKGRWASVRQVDIALGDFTLGKFVGPAYPEWVDPEAGSELKNLYPGIFRPAQEDTTHPGYPDMDDVDTIRLQVRPYREDPNQTTESIHLLTPGEVYEMGMNFSVVNVGIDRFSISVAAQHYPGNENFTGIACETGHEEEILAKAPDGPLRDVSIYLWTDSDADGLPDAYTISTGVITPPQGDGPPLVSAEARYAAVCSAVGPLVCGNPQAPSNCNFLGYVPVQFTMTAMMK